MGYLDAVMWGSRDFNESINSLRIGWSSRATEGAILCRTSEFLCFLLGRAPSLISKAEVAFSALKALRNELRAYLPSLKANLASSS